MYNLSYFSISFASLYAAILFNVVAEDVRYKSCWFFSKWQLAILLPGMAVRRAEKSLMAFYLILVPADARCNSPIVTANDLIQASTKQIPTHFSASAM